MHFNALHSTVFLATLTLSSGLIAQNTITFSHNLPLASSTCLYSSSSSPEHINDQRLSFRNFLTQRSIQSFQSLTSWQLRDPHTSDWIARFVGFPGLLEFHGIGGFDVEEWGEWDKVFLELMKREEEKIVLQVRRKGASNRSIGGSKNNPFLQDDEFVEYVINIDPKSLATRIIAVREQIADEIAQDLSLIAIHNKEILESHHSSQRSSDDDDNTQTHKRIAIPITVHLDNSLAMVSKMSSPLRKGTFDLLQILTLQESIHRILRSYAAELEEDEGLRDKKISFEWLKEFYLREVDEFFDGSGDWGRADGFINQLIEQSPRIVTLDGGADGSGERTAGLVDPSRITQDILEESSRVSMEWMEIASAVREEHSGLQKALLMKTWDDVIKKEEEEKEVTVVNMEEGFE